MNNALQTLLEVSLYSSAMIIAVLALGKLLSGKISAKVVHILWLLVLLRLLLPVTFETPAGLPYPDVLGKPLEAATQEQQTAPGLSGMSYSGSAEYENPSYLPAGSAAEKEPSDKPASKFDIKTLIIILWLAGAVFIPAVSLYKYAVYSRKIGNVKKINPMYGARLELAKKALNINRNISLASSKYTDIPLVFGILRPVILFPEGFEGAVGGKKLSYIILHELCHIKRRDILLNHIWLVARAVNWFNPLVHIAYESYLDTVEQACDEMVLRCLENHDRYEYSQSLLDVARIANGSRKPVLSVSLFRGTTSLRKRVMKMMHSKKKSKTFTIITVLIACIMCFACFTTACQPAGKAIEDSREPQANTEAEPSPTPPPEAAGGIEISYSHSEINKPTKEESPSYAPGMSEEEARQIVAQLGLSEVKTIQHVERKDYFGDSLVYFYCNEVENSALYVFLESVRSPVSFENKAVDMTIPIELSDDEFKTIASDFAKKIWGYDDIEFTSCEAGTLGSEEDFCYFGADGVINETGRIFDITLNGQGTIRGFSSYPPEVDMEKGVSIDEARQNALTLLREQAHITDESNLTLISETLSTEHAPMFIFKYEYRSDNPNAEEYDYDCEVKVMAADGRTMGAGINPITSNIDVIQPDEAEQMAKEHIAKETGVDASKLETRESWARTDGDDGIIYSFMFDYNSDYRYSIMMLATGEFWDISSGPIN